MTTPEFKGMGRRNLVSEINVMTSTALQDRRNEDRWDGEPGRGAE